MLAVDIGGSWRLYQWVFALGRAMINIESSDIVRKGCMSKGKQPRTRVNKVPKLLLSEMKTVFFQFVQEMGLGAAIF